MAAKSASPAQLKPRFRVVCGKEIAIGPGKMELLAALVETRSLTDAARRLGMSYMRAWTLIHTMNHHFREPVVAAERGGKRGGGTTVTQTGHRVLELYRHMESAALKSAADPWRQLQELLRR
jgi:molybdate transport system regulatory protein